MTVEHIFVWICDNCELTLQKDEYKKPLGWVTVSSAFDIKHYCSEECKEENEK
ncbi:MAG: hypothetical protein ACYSR0_00495 [Planctomycetota bacterium]|jgi:hypothetical protein